MKVLFATRPIAPIPAHDDKYKTGITGRRYALTFTKPFYFGWDMQYRTNGDWRCCNSPGYFGAGIYGPWLKPGYDEFLYDGSVFCSIVFGPFRINWNREAHDSDWL